MLLQDWIVLFVTLISAYTDYRRGKILNKVTYPALLAGLLLSFVSPPPNLLWSFSGMLVAFLFFLWLHRIGGMGGGDVKLMAAVGALKGLGFVVFATFYVFCIGALIGLALLVWRGRLLPVLKWIGKSLASIFVPSISAEPLAERSTRMPFGPVIFIGTAYCVYLEISRGIFSLW